MLSPVHAAVADEYLDDLRTAAAAVRGGGPGDAADVAARYA